MLGKKVKTVHLSSYALNGHIAVLSQSTWYRYYCQEGKHEVDVNVFDHDYPHEIKGKATFM